MFSEKYDFTKSHLIYKVDSSLLFGYQIYQIPSWHQEKQIKTHYSKADSIM